VPERFRAVAPSAVLLKGLSPDSSYREWAGMIQKRPADLKRGDLIYLDHRPWYFHRPAGALTTRAFRLPACLDQFCNDDVAMIALNFDDAIAHGAARPTAFFKFCRERFKIRRRQRQTPNGRDAFTGTALGLASNPHCAGLGYTGCSLGAHALAHRPPAIGAQAADAR